MGVGYLGLFDRIDHTVDSEYDSREGESITTLQIHHTASTSDSGARALMDPGGRTVSSNGLLLRDGTLDEVVPGQFRALTSASGFDRQSLTVETVNQTGPDEWGISEKQRLRLAKLHRDMAAAGLPTTPGKRGVGGLIGHFEVPGTYATACPGPSMYLDHIANLARTGEDDMPLNPDTDYAAFAAMLQRALKFDARRDGLGADWRLGPTLWERIGTLEKAITAQIAGLNPDVDEAELAAALAPLLDVSALSEEDLQRLAARVEQALGGRFDALPQRVRDEIVAPD
jgi:hypothetical protein